MGTPRATQPVLLGVASRPELPTAALRCTHTCASLTPTRLRRGAPCALFRLLRRALRRLERIPQPCVLIARALQLRRSARARVRQLRLRVQRARVCRLQRRFKLLGRPCMPRTFLLVPATRPAHSEPRACASQDDRDPWRYL